jgi:hypothetical protein
VLADAFLQFKNDHHNPECTRHCWDFIEQLWSEASSREVGSEVEVVDGGKAHLCGRHDIAGEKALIWMLYPGFGTGPDYPRLEVHFDSLYERLPPSEATERVEKAARELAKVGSWRRDIKRENLRRWNLRLGEFRVEHAVQCAIAAIAILTSNGLSASA